MQIGPYVLENNLILAPMAGVTDRPFRQLCKRLGAGLVVSEMLSSNPSVWNSDKSKQRMDHEGEEGVRSVQIAGSDPELMAQAAQFNVGNGAQLVDINMGCPAKKVNKKSFIVFLIILILDRYDFDHKHCFFFSIATNCTYI